MSGLVELSKDELSKALRNVEYALPRKSAGASAMSGKIRLRSSASGLQFQSSDGGSYITHTAPVRVDEVDLIVPLSPLKKSLGAFEESSFMISAGSAEDLLIRQIGGSRELTLQGEAPPGLAPEWPELSGEKQAGVISETRELADAIERALLFAARETDRPVLASLSFNLRDDNLAATDSYRIIQTDLPEITGRRSQKPDQALITAKTAQALARICRREQGELRLSHCAGVGLVFRIGGVELIAAGPDGKFPDPAELLGAVRSSSELRVSREALISSLRAISALNEGGKKESPAVFELAEGASKLSFASSEGSSLSEDLTASYSGSPLQICFNQKYLSDALKAISGEELQIKLSSSSAPALLSDSQTVCLLMPVRKKTLS